MMALFYLISLLKSLRICKGTLCKDVTTIIPSAIQITLKMISRTNSKVHL